MTAGLSKVALGKVQLSKEQVDHVFEVHENQTDVVIDLHKLVYKAIDVDWDDIERLDDFCSCSHETSMYITEKFCEFDRKHHPETMPGGAWINWGFSSYGPECLELNMFEVVPAPFWFKEVPNDKR